MMTLEEERRLYEAEKPKYERLVRLARKVHQPCVVTSFRLRVTDADGRVRTDRRSFSHSYVRNLYVAHTQITLYRAYLGDNDPIGDGYADGQLGMKKTNGVVWGNGVYFTLTPSSAGGYRSERGELFGIVVGTGTTAEDFEAWRVEGTIGHGNPGNPGVMFYNTTTFSEAWVAGDRYYKSEWTRRIDNNSGDTITVGNIGLYFSTGISGVFMFIHDVLGPPQGVDDGERLTVDQEFRVYFP